LSSRVRRISIALGILLALGLLIGVASGDRLTAHKVGTRYVQSRTAAGGWSQQRFARRRTNQADGEGIVVEPLRPRDPLGAVGVVGGEPLEPAVEARGGDLDDAAGHVEGIRC